MRSKSSARAPAQNLSNVLIVLFLGFLLVATVWAVRRGTEQGDASYENRLETLGRLFDTRVETVTVTPTTFDREDAMSPKALLDRWEPLILEASKRFHVPAVWIRAVMRMESGGRTVLADNKPITSDAGAMGIMQVEPGTYAEMAEQYGLGSDPYDPHDNVMAGAAYLRWLHGKYGYPAMFAAYNDGPGNVEDHLYRGRKYPAETKTYIASITKMLGHAKSGNAALARFTRPDGSPVWIDSTKVNTLRTAQPGEYDGSVQTVIGIGRRLQAVREDLATAAALLRDHGGNV